MIFHGTEWARTKFQTAAKFSTPMRPVLESLEQRVFFSAATINWNDVHQTIAGFGASSAFLQNDLPKAEETLLYSATQGIGLSLLRTRIAPGDSVVPAVSTNVLGTNAAEIQLAKDVQPLGATVWSTPWTPPADWKSNGSTNNQNGGYLLASHYQDYAKQLANYWLNMKAQGVNIYAISLQNEPDVWVGYEGCTWSDSQLAAFLPIVAQTFTAQGVAAKIMLPEEGHWDFSLADQIFSNPDLMKYVGIVAAHDYGPPPSLLPSASGAYAPVPQAAGKQLWETEVSSQDTFDPSINNGLFWAKNIHDALTVAHASAWNYWWLTPLNGSNDNEALLGANGQTTKRLFAVGNYSKFIRPGWVNLGETDTGGVSVSAFKNPTNGQFAVVVVNSGAQVSEQVGLNGFAASSVTPWVTSSSSNLAAQQTILTSNGGSTFTATLAAQSVTTFVGQASASKLPLAPQNVTVASGANQATLTWSASTGAASYDLYRGITPGSEGPTPLRTGITSTSFTDAGLTNGHEYYYQISAVNGAGQSAKSAEAIASPQTPATSGSNLLSNPGFESGAFAPWGNSWASITSGNAHAGTYSANVYGSGSGGIWQDLTNLTPNTTYTLSAYVKNTTGATAYLFAKNIDGSGEVDASVNNVSFSQGSLTFRTGPSETAAEVGIWKLSGTVYADDFSFSAAPIVPANLLSNPGFESGSFGPWGNNWATVATGDAHSGTFSVSIYGSGSGGLWQDLANLTPNTTYTLSAYVKNTTGATAYLFAKNIDGTGEVNANFNNASYGLISLTFTTGPAVTRMEVGLWKLSGTITADDFSLVSN